MTLTFATPPSTVRRSSLDGSALLITGCNTGIGRELARQSLALGARLRFTCRTREKAIATAVALRAEFPGADIRGYELDLEDATGVDRLVAALDRASIDIDTVILNAGVHRPFGYHAATNGEEIHHQVNFLAPARLFLSLAGRAKPPTRVLYVSSNAHQRGQLPAVFPLSYWARYAQSKLKATTFFIAARALYPNTTISVLSPGSVITDVDRHKPAVAQRLRRASRRAQLPAAAAADLLRGAFTTDEPELYRNRGEIVPASPSCYAPDAQLSVWTEAVDGHATPSATHVIVNHAETVSRLAPPVRYPVSEREVAEIMREVRSASRTLRVVGSRHSYNDCFYSHSELMSLEHLAEMGEIHVRRASGAQEASATITVGAGVTVQSLCDYLDARGWALRWAGNSGKQTLVGAAITGTHGYGRTGGLLAELIVGARVVTGDGEVLEMNGEEELRALRVSLGTLGVVTSVTLELVPAGRPVRYALETLDQRDFLRRICELGRTNEYFRFFPNRYHPDRFSILTINPVGDAASEKPSSTLRYIDTTSAPRPLVACLRAVMRSRLAHSILRRLPAPRLKMSLVAPFSTLLFVNAGIVARWHWLAGLIYQTWNDDRTRNMELAVRPEDFASFLTVYRNAEAAFHRRTGEVSTYFTGRYVGGSDRTLIGPNHRRDVVFVDVHVRRTPEATDFLRDLEARLRDVISVRPHWGKEFRQDHEAIRGEYPQESWNAFVDAKRRYDPRGVLSNGYTSKVFGW